MAIAARAATAATAPNIKKANLPIVLATYRHLLRATGIAFQGDESTKQASRRFARESFDKNCKLRSGSIEASQGIEHAQGVAKILRENVVQGKDIGDKKYKLNIHKYTERGDNETAKKLKGSTQSFREIKNARF